MNKILFNILLVGLLISCSSVKKYNAQIAKLHSVEELHNDVDQAYGQLQKFHPQLNRYISREALDGKFNNLKKNIDRPMGSREFYERLAEVINEVRQGHLNVRPPLYRFTKKEQKAILKRKFEFYDLDFEQLENTFWIKDFQGRDSTIIGDQVLAIEKESAAKLMEKYKKLSSSDGFNTTFYDRYTAAAFSSFYYSDKGYRDSLTLLLKKKDSVYFRTFRRIAKTPEISKDSLAQKIPNKLSKDEMIALKTKRKAKKKDGKKRGYLPSRDQYLRNFDFIGKDSSTAYLKIRGFGRGKPKKFYREVFAKIDSARTGHLILDLRYNFGGDLEEIADLFSYLALKPYKFLENPELKTRFPLTKSLYSEKGVGFFSKTLRIIGAPAMVLYDLVSTRKKNGKLYRKFSESKTKVPLEQNFKGKIYVLINGGSFSASSLLAANLHASKRAVFVGEETGGSYNSTVAGQTKHVILPNSKVYLYFGLMQIEVPQQTEPDGYGVKPDIEIIPTQEDRLQKRDPELDWILQDIYKN